MTSAQRPSRDIRGILGFLHKGEVDAIFKQQPFELQQKHTDPARAWRTSFDAVRALPPAATNVNIGLLDETHLPVIREVKARATFAKYYEAVDDYQFALVPISALVSPQWFADLDYIKELASQISENPSTEQLIRFSMAEGAITEPIVVGTQVIFSSLRPDLHADPVPTVLETSPGEFEITVRAHRRPNYVSVAAVGGRLWLTNGVHHACALLLRGLDTVPCVLRTVTRVEETGLNLQTSLFRPELIQGPRPALVADFLDDRVAVPLTLRAMYHVLRIGIGVDSLRTPAIQDEGLHRRPDTLTTFPHRSELPSGETALGSSGAIS